jgi:hypothetical protein
MSYDRGMLVSGILGVTGVGFLVPLLLTYVKQGFALTSFSHTAIFGLLLVILGFQTFGFTLLSEMVQRVARRQS